MKIDIASSLLVTQCLSIMNNMKKINFKYQQLTLGLLVGLLIGIGFMYIVDLNTKELNVASTINFSEEFYYQSAVLKKDFDVSELNIADEQFKNSVSEISLRGSFTYRISLMNTKYNLEDKVLTLLVPEAVLDDVIVDFDKSVYIDTRDGLLSLKEMRIRLCDYDYLKDEFKQSLSTDYKSVEEEALKDLHNQVSDYVNKLFANQDIEIIINYQ